jgi:PTH1 family peptidyl-tRNA hydrolase
MYVRKKTNSMQEKVLNIIEQLNPYGILVVGLGNPGYFKTRHNVGSDFLIERINSKNANKINNNLYLYPCKNYFVLLYVMPDTMNISGKNILKMYRDLNCKELVVLVDDLDSKCGKIKKSFGVSAGGHNGTRSIIEFFGHNKFWQFKIGIGRPIDNKISISQFVLEKFTEDDTLLIFNQNNYKIFEDFMEEILESKKSLS